MPRIRKPLPSPRIGISLYFTRKGFTEPDIDDIYHVKVPESIIKKYTDGDNDIYEILDYLQYTEENDILNENLNNEEYVSSIVSLRLEVCEFSGDIGDSIRKTLIENIRNNRFDELDELLYTFFLDHNIPENERSEFLKNYMINKY